MSNPGETTSSAPRLTELDHGSISVGDIDEATVFYRDVLGLSPIPRPDFGFPGAWFSAGSVDLHLTTGGEMRAAGTKLKPNDSHLAFRTNDAEGMLDKLNTYGVSVWELPNSPAAKRQIFFNDPWGNLLEIIVH